MSQRHTNFHLINAAEVARIFDVHPATVRKWHRAREIPGFWFDGKLYFSLISLLQILGSPPSEESRARMKKALR